MKPQISSRVSEQTRKQVDELVANLGYSIRDIITVAIDRMHEKEAAMVKQIRCNPGQVAHDAAEEAGYDPREHRVGHWHQSARPGETLVAEVHVRPGDPPIPVFKRK